MPNRALPILLLAALTGCTHWVKDEMVLAAPAPDARKQFQIFTLDGPMRVHGVRLDSTSLSYVSYLLPPGCDSCRVTIPLATVDSVRTGRLSPTRNGVLAVIVILLGIGMANLPGET